LFCYGIAKRAAVADKTDIFRHACYYVFGTIGPVGLLWFYQWKSFGHPFYPGQHWMPPVEWIELGYQGVGRPQLELLLALAFDYRFGLFVTCPLLLLALVAPFANRRSKQQLPWFEMALCLALFLVLWVFFSGVNYVRLQYNTGIRYLTPIFPFLFLPVAVVLMRLPRRVIYFISLFSFFQAWCLAMYRDVERGLGVLDPILHVFFGGLKLPALTVLSRMSTSQYGEYFADGVSPLPLFLITAAILYGIWSRRLSIIPEMRYEATREEIGVRRSSVGEPSSSGSAHESGAIPRSKSLARPQ
jgi:hypothetical protein